MNSLLDAIVPNDTSQTRHVVKGVEEPNFFPSSRSAHGHVQ